MRPRPDIHIGVCGTPGCHDPECEIPFGYCHCGCGGKTQLAHQSRAGRQWLRNLPKMWIRSHSAKKHWSGPSKLRKDIRGQRFGRLVAQSVDYINGEGFWNCLCDCGKSNHRVNVRNLINGNVRSCGCLKREITSQRMRKDRSEQRYGRLTTVDIAYTINNRLYWNCICDCGNTVIVKGDNLESGNTRSCGCFHYENKPRQMVRGNIPVSTVVVKRDSDWPNVHWDSRKLYRPWTARVLNNGRAVYADFDDELRAALWAVERKLEYGHVGREQLLARRFKILNCLTQT